MSVPATSRPTRPASVMFPGTKLIWPATGARLAWFPA